MNNKRRILVWMNCYGHWDPGNRSQVETKGYDQYLTAFVERLLPLRDQIDIIYISGGMLDSKGRTECQTVKPEIARLLKSYDVDLPVITDEKSLTTITIARTFVKIVREKYPSHLALLFCDGARYKVNCYLVRYFSKKFNFPLKPNEVVVPLPRIDTHPDSTKEAQEEKLERMKKEGAEAVEAEQIKERSKKL